MKVHSNQHYFYNLVVLIISHAEVLLSSCCFIMRGKVQNQKNRLFSETFWRELVLILCLGNNVV